MSPLNRIAVTSPTGKSSAWQLALFGGEPLFVEHFCVGRPNLPPFETYAKLMREAFDRRWLTNRGPLVQRFEDEIACRTDARHCIAVANATLGLQIAAVAADVRGEVILPAFTFIATAHAFRWVGIEPVLADVQYQTHQLDPASVVDRWTDRTGAIVGVHLWGETCDVEALEEIARERGVPLLFDAAHAFGCSYRSKQVGNHGLAEVFSFHATKFINCFEGGAICTNDDAFASRVRSILNFGFRDGEATAMVGTNAKMSESSAAMGLATLEQMEEIIAHNRKVYDLYSESLTGQKGVQLYPYQTSESRNYQYVVLEVNPMLSELSRDEIVRVLALENIIARKYFAPGLHRHEPYASGSTGQVHVPVTDALCQQVFLLPTGTAVSIEAAQQIGQVLRTVLDHAGTIASRLRSVRA
ncbi:DegT/DnrJ/EryC1/StrS family aminotransferase [bacterium]|nr:DegT/DnrJ/EryC1/StrS family aminotransferase [bacterium]